MTKWRHKGTRPHFAPKGKRGSSGSPGSLLRGGYNGFCPLEVDNGSIAGGGGSVERRHWTDLTPEKFFDAYVKARKPVVISTHGVSGGALGVLFGLQGEAARWSLPGAEGIRSMGESPAAACQVVVERRLDKSRFFGQSDDTKRESTTFGHFCQELESGNELAYLTTQALEDENGCPKSLFADHVMKLLAGSQTLRPDLIGQLAPVQYNMWFGRSSAGSSSGLHHDFHDNLYILLRGTKEFRLFSPRCFSAKNRERCNDVNNDGQPFRNLFFCRWDDFEYLNPIPVTYDIYYIHNDTKLYITDENKHMQLFLNLIMLPLCLKIPSLSRFGSSTANSLASSTASQQWPHHLRPEAPRRRGSKGRCQRLAARPNRAAGVTTPRFGE